MHEFKLGVWKALLLHLVWILYSIGASTVQEFNHWYALFSTCNVWSPELSVSFWQITSFGSTIHPFTHNIANMKKLAAQDFEDILQVCWVLIVSNAQHFSSCTSVAFLALKAYCLRHIMTLSSSFYFLHPIGIPLQSYDCTLRQPSRFLTMSQCYLQKHFTTSKRLLAHVSTQLRLTVSTMQGAEEQRGGCPANKPTLNSCLVPVAGIIRPTTC